MDWLTNLIKDHKIPVGQWGKSFFDWFINNFETAFDTITAGLKIPIEGAVVVLNFFPPPLLILFFAVIAYCFQRSIKLVVFIVIGLAMILNQGLWAEMLETLVLVIFATLISLSIGIPVGILAARRRWVYSLLSPVLDLMQTMPTFVYLLPALILFGLGMVPGLVATIIFAIPAPIRLTYVGISEVPKSLVEAGEAFGCTRWQLLTRVKLPAALSTIAAGINQCIMLSLSMVVIAALVGANGLGKPIVRALNQVNIQLGIEAGFAIVVLAIILDRMLHQKPKTKRSSEET